MSNVYLACPLYDGTLQFGAARGIWNSSRQHQVRVGEMKLSLIPHNCTAHWCVALNLQKELNLQWFAMLHADVSPDLWWIDTLIAAAEKHGADLMSAGVPLKDDSGLLSMGIWRPGGLFGTCHRLTLAQFLHPQFPDTFGVHEAVDALAQLPSELRITGLPREGLLVNTGCMVVRIDQPWATKVWFNDPTGMEQVDGQWQAVSMPEDWFFSQRVAQEGGKVMATRLVRVIHRGTVDFPNDRAWGQAQDSGGAAT
jgi:hypothetical protein